MSNVDDLLVRIDASVEGLRRELRQGEQQVDRFAGKVDRQTRTIDASFERLTQAARVARTAVVAVSAAAAGSTGIRTMAQFEQSMARVGAISQATADEMADLEQVARRMGATTQFSAQQAGEGLGFLAMAGFSASESARALPAVLDLAAAAQMNLGQAADITSNILSGFGASATESARVADILAAAASSANTSVEQMGEAMSFAAPIAQSYGLSIEASAAAMSTLSNAGIQASRAGTSFNRVLNEFAAPGQKTINLMRQIGVSLEEIDPTRVEFSEIIQRLDEAGLGAEEFAGAVTEAFGERGAPALQAFLAQSEKLDELNRIMAESAGRASEMADAMGDNLAGDARELVSAISELVLQAGDSGLLGVMRGVTQTATDVALVFAGMDEAISGNVAVAKTLATSLELVAVAAAAIGASHAARALSGIASSTIDAVRASAARRAALITEAEADLALRGAAQQSAAQLAANRDAALSAAQGHQTRFAALERSAQGTVRMTAASQALAAADRQVATAHRAAAAAALQQVQAANAAAVASDRLAAAQQRVTVAARASAAAMSTARSAMAFLGGPIGASIAGLAAITFGLSEALEFTASEALLTREEIARMASGADAAADDIDTLTEAVGGLEEVLRRSRAEFLTSEDFADLTPAEQREVLEETEQRLASLAGQIDGVNQQLVESFAALDAARQTHRDAIQAHTDALEGADRGTVAFAAAVTEAEEEVGTLNVRINMLQERLTDLRSEQLRQQQAAQAVRDALDDQADAIDRVNQAARGFLAGTFVAEPDPGTGLSFGGPSAVAEAVASNLQEAINVGEDFGRVVQRVIPWWQRWKREARGAGRATSEATDAVEEHTRGLEAENALLADLLGQLESGALAVEDLEAERQLLNQAQRLGIEQGSDEFKLLQKLTEQNQAYEDAIANVTAKHQAQQDAQDAATEALAAHKEELGRVAEKIESDIYRGMSESFVDALTGQQDAWEDIWGDMRDFALDILADMAEEMILRPLLQPVIQPVAQGLANMFVGPGPSAGGGVGGGGKGVKKGAGGGTFMPMGGGFDLDWLGSGFNDFLGTTFYGGGSAQVLTTKGGALTGGGATSMVKGQPPPGVTGADFLGAAGYGIGAGLNFAGGNYIAGVGQTAASVMMLIPGAQPFAPIVAIGSQILDAIVGLDANLDRPNASARAFLGEDFRDVGPFDLFSEGGKDPGPAGDLVSTLSSMAFGLADTLDIADDALNDFAVKVFDGADSLDVELSFAASEILSSAEDVANAISSADFVRAFGLSEDPAVGGESAEYLASTGIRDRGEVGDFTVEFELASGDAEGAALAFTQAFLIGLQDASPLITAEVAALIDEASSSQELDALIQEVLTFDATIKSFTETLDGTAEPINPLIAGFDASRDRMQELRDQAERLGQVESIPLLDQMEDFLLQQGRDDFIATRQAQERQLTGLGFIDQLEAVDKQLQMDLELVHQEFQLPEIWEGTQENIDALDQHNEALRVSGSVAELTAMRILESVDLSKVSMDDLIAQFPGLETAIRSAYGAMEEGSDTPRLFSTSMQAAMDAVDDRLNQIENPDAYFEGTDILIEKFPEAAEAIDNLAGRPLDEMGEALRGVGGILVDTGATGDELTAIMTPLNDEFERSTVAAAAFTDTLKQQRGEVLQSIEVGLAQRLGGESAVRDLELFNAGLQGFSAAINRIANSTSLKDAEAQLESFFESIENNWAIDPDELMILQEAAFGAFDQWLQDFDDAQRRRDQDQSNHDRQIAQLQKDNAKLEADNAALQKQAADEQKRAADIQRQVATGIGTSPGARDTVVNQNTDRLNDILSGPEFQPTLYDDALDIFDHHFGYATGRQFGIGHSGPFQNPPTFSGSLSEGWSPQDIIDRLIPRSNAPDWEADWRVVTDAPENVTGMYGLFENVLDVIDSAKGGNVDGLLAAFDLIAELPDALVEYSNSWDGESKMSGQDLNLLFQLLFSTFESGAEVLREVTEEAEALAGIQVQHRDIFERAGRPLDLTTLLTAQGIGEENPITGILQPHEGDILGGTLDPTQFVAIHDALVLLDDETGQVPGIINLLAASVAGLGDASAIASADLAFARATGQEISLDQILAAQGLDADSDISDILGADPAAAAAIVDGTLGMGEAIALQGQLNQARADGLVTDQEYIDTIRLLNSVIGEADTTATQQIADRLQALRDEDARAGLSGADLIEFDRQAELKAVTEEFQEMGAHAADLDEALGLINAQYDRQQDLLAQQEARTLAQADIGLARALGDVAGFGDIVTAAGIQSAEATSILSDYSAGIEQNTLSTDSARTAADALRQAHQDGKISTDELTAALGLLGGAVEPVVDVIVDAAQEAQTLAQAGLQFTRAVGDVASFGQIVVAAGISSADATSILAGYSTEIEQGTLSADQARTAQAALWQAYRDGEIPIEELTASLGVLGGAAQAVGEQVQQTAADIASAIQGLYPRALSLLGQDLESQLLSMHLRHQSERAQFEAAGVDTSLLDAIAAGERGGLIFDSAVQDLIAHIDEQIATQQEAIQVQQDAIRAQQTADAIRVSDLSPLSRGERAEEAIAQWRAARDAGDIARTTELARSTLQAVEEYAPRGTTEFGEYYREIVGALDEFGATATLDVDEAQLDELSEIRAALQSGDADQIEALGDLGDKFGPLGDDVDRARLDLSADLDAVRTIIGDGDSAALIAMVEQTVALQDIDDTIGQAAIDIIGAIEAQAAAQQAALPEPPAANPALMTAAELRALIFAETTLDDDGHTRWGTNRYHGGPLGLQTATLMGMGRADLIELADALGLSTVPMFAMGGAFGPSGIIDTPTLFGFGGGRVGLMGEAGPEAILPLASGPGGALGVHAYAPPVPSMPASHGDGSAEIIRALREEIGWLREEIRELRDERRTGDRIAADGVRVLERAIKTGSVPEKELAAATARDGARRSRR